MSPLEKRDQEPNGQPFDDLRAKRGRDFSQWLKRVAVDLRTGAELTASEISRLTGVSRTRIRVLLNDCFDRADETVKLPKEPTVRKIADGLSTPSYQVDVNEALALVGIVPQQSAKGVFIPDPGMIQREFTTAGGKRIVIFFPADEENPDHRIEVLKAFYAGAESGK